MLRYRKFLNCLSSANGNRYEGNWEDDKKNGRGTFYFIKKNQEMSGVWLDDIPKCVVLIDKVQNLRKPECNIPKVNWKIFFYFNINLHIYISMQYISILLSTCI